MLHRLEDLSAADISQQISTASRKHLGQVIAHDERCSDLGTHDGANVEIREVVGMTAYLCLD